MIFLEDCAKNLTQKIVFTAPNFDDNAETVLYRIIRGTGTIGLQGIAEKMRHLLQTSFKNNKS